MRWLHLLSNRADPDQTALLAKSEDSDQTAPKEQSDQCLHCLLSLISVLIYSVNMVKLLSLSE